MLNTLHLKTKNSSLNPSFPSNFSTISLLLCTEKLHKSSVYFFCLHFLTPNLSLTYFYNTTKIALIDVTSDSKLLNSAFNSQSSPYSFNQSTRIWFSWSFPWTYLIYSGSGTSHCPRSSPTSLAAPSRLYLPPLKCQRTLNKTWKVEGMEAILPVAVSSSRWCEILQ